MTGAAISEVGRLETENNLLRQKVQRLEADLAAWRPYIHTKVEQVKVGEGSYGFGILVSVAKTNKKGFIESISPDKVNYYMNDRGGLVTKLSEILIDKLIREEAINLIKPDIEEALNNIASNTAKLK